MTDALSADTQFASVEKFVHKLVWAFRSRYGCEVDELLSEAFMGYMDAVESYDERTKFVSWVGEKVKFRLMSFVRTQMQRRKGEKITDVPQPTHPVFDPDEILAKLSPDGQELLGLVIDTPVPILCDIARLGETPANYRYALRVWLRDCGWAKKRIIETFSEIREAL